MTDSQEYDIKGLILELLDQTISSERRQKLRDILNSDPEAQKYYAEYIMLCASLRQYGAATALTPLCDSKDNFDYSLLEDLANSEESAPAAPIEKAVEVEEVKAKPVKKKRSRKILLAYVSIAALIFIVVSVNNLFKAKPVAVIKDSINAKWSDMDLTEGCTLFDSDGFLKLESGVVKLEYKDATVIVEGPCEFASKSNNRIKMLSGSVYVKMVEGRNGYVVETPVSTIVDLGTEFGVQIHNGNSTEVHVLKGKASVSASCKPDKSQTFEAGSAGLVSSNGAEITGINLDKFKFVREIDSNTNTISRGRTHIDLASITTGCDGRMAALDNYWLDPELGLTENALKSQVHDNKYMPLEFNQYVDGIFVPKGPGNQISSTGMIFEDCPKTCADYYANIGVNPKPELLEVPDKRTGNIIFNGRDYGNALNPCIVMHANIGITYDLRAIAKEYPYRRISRFYSKVGIADLDEPYPCNADIWVLIDGQVRSKIAAVKEKGKLLDIEVEINENDKFLTLVVTDGGDIDIMEAYKRAITCDWCVFTSPVLELY